MREKTEKSGSRGRRAWIIAAGVLLWLILMAALALLLDAPEEGGETVKAEITFIVSSQEVFSCSFTVGQSQMAELQSLADQLNHGQTLYRIMLAEAQ